MKTYFTSILILLFGYLSFAQNGINYKAVIKDNNGSVIANQQITVRFSIIKGVAQTIAYSETHTLTTDSNGLILAIIGGGTPTSGIFNALVWGSDIHSLKVEIDTGSGYIDLGTTGFRAVPYALNITGLEQITENGNTGLRFKGRDPAKYGNIGNNALDLSLSEFTSSIKGATGEYATALGAENIASGRYATVAGVGCIASGEYSTAMGYINTASGKRATALGSFTDATGENATSLGSNTTASGERSMAMGGGTEASGSYSIATGRETIAMSYASLSIGRFNLGIGSSLSWVATDPILEIGNGTSNAIRSNAMTVLKNGNVGIGIASPAVKLQILGGIDAGLPGGTGYLVIGNQGSHNLVFDTNEIMARNLGNPSALYLQNEGGNVYVGGALVHSSDRRLKEDITDLQYGLNEILQMQPKSYHWKNREQSHKSFGLIAQELQPIIRELVLEQDDEDKTLSVNYSELIPVLINAIKEQQSIITSEKVKVANLEAKLLDFESFNKRLKSLEDSQENRITTLKN